MPGSKKTEDAFQRKSKLPATFFDLTMAFDKSWKEGLIIKLIQKRDWRQNAEADKGLSEQKTWKDQTSEEQKKKKNKEQNGNYIRRGSAGRNAIPHIIHHLHQRPAQAVCAMHP